MVRGRDRRGRHFLLCRWCRRRRFGAASRVCPALVRDCKHGWREDDGQVGPIHLVLIRSFCDRGEEAGQVDQSGGVIGGEETGGENEGLYTVRRRLRESFEATEKMVIWASDLYTQMTEIGIVLTHVHDLLDEEKLKFCSKNW